MKRIYTAMKFLTLLISFLSTLFHAWKVRSRRSIRNKRKSSKGH